MAVIPQKLGSESGSTKAQCAIAAYVADDPSGWLPSILNLREVEHCAQLLVTTSARCRPLDRIETDLVVDSLAELLAVLAEPDDVDWIVVAGEPCLAPVQLVSRLSDFTDERLASVSFLSNSAGPLSFPFVGTPVEWAIDGGTADSLTSQLRQFEPLPPPVPVPFASGPVVAFSAPIVRMLPPGWDRGSDSWSEVVAAFALSTQARGLFNVLDAATYVHRSADLRPLGQLGPEATARLQQRFAWMGPSISFTAMDPSSPLRLEHGLARTKISGLNVLLDGSCLGPVEMGTQVGLLAIAGALAMRSDVASVAITLPNQIPLYARHLLQEPRISFIPAPFGADLDTDRRFDVAFRPFQPDVSFDTAFLRRYADRVIVSILDLIAYQNGSYFRSGEEWARYRGAIVGALRLVDAMTTISHDVARIVRMERMPIAPDRVYPVPYGTEHLEISAPLRMPEGFDATPGARFMVCLGTNYGHKNRDTAIRALRLLRARGHDLKLLLVGPAVPFGSSRELEAEAMMDLSSQDVVMMQNVAADERNWLLAHAELVLYPTSAEGFGLVPYEAAALGTPTIFFPFGPLSEVAGDLPMEARDWSPEAFAEQVEALIADPSLGQLQVQRLLEASAKSTWALTAGALCDVFRSVLAKAPIS